MRDIQTYIEGVLKVWATILAQTPIDPAGLIDLLSKGSSLVLAVVLVGLQFEWLVPGRTHRAALANRDAVIVSKDAEIARLQSKVDDLTGKLVEAVQVTGAAVSKARPPASR